MGAVLSQLKPVTHERPTCPLLNTSLSKIREFHASFKAICDNFRIDLTEFEQIFSTNETSFAIWDTDDNGFIDALELFSGLVVFADCKFQDKIRFLFDLFDFNELGQLSTTELQCILHCCLNSTFKIYGIDKDVDHEAISEFIESYFPEDTMINLHRLTKWCYNSEEINNFFSAIKKDPPGIKMSTAPIQFNAFSTFGEKEKSREPQPSRRTQETRAINEIFSSQKYKTKLEYLTNTMSKNPSSKDEAFPKLKIKDSVAKMKWVYGFRCNDVRHPLQYSGNESGKATSEKLFYLSGCIVIVYFPKANEQLHYVEHDKEVISLAVSQAGLIASGELGDKPAIHVWDCTTLQNISILKGVHNTGISLLCFIKNNDLLASCGVRENSPLLIYNIRDGTLVLSTYLKGFALDLRTVRPYVKVKGEQELRYEEGKTNTFIACTDHELYLFTYETGVFTTGEIKMGDFEVQSEVTCCLAYSYDYINEDSQGIERKIVTLTGHKNGKVYMWENMQDKREIDTCKGAIIDMIGYDSYIVIASTPSDLHFWDLQMRNKMKTSEKGDKPIDLSALKIKLFNYRIGSLTSANKKLYVSTVEGDVVEMIIKTKKESKFELYKIQARRMNHICRLRGAMRALMVVEKPEDTIVYVGGHSEALSAFSSESHQLVHLASMGQVITAVDAIDLEDGRKKVCIGTGIGELQIRIENQTTLVGYKPSEPIEEYMCEEKAILDLKFSDDEKYLFVVTEHGEMLLFTQTEGKYFHAKEDNLRKFVLENEFPISVNFSDDSKSVLVGTSQRNHYALDLTHPSNKLVKIDQFGDRTDFSILNLRYPSHTKNFLNTMQPTSFWNTVKAILAADESGIIFHWKDIDDLINNCGAYLRGHSSSISRFALTKNSNIFFSLGHTDRTLIEWEIDNITEEIKKKYDELMNSDTRESHQVYEEVLNREITYTTFSDTVSDRLRDSFVLFRGTNDKTINAMLYDNIGTFDDTALTKRVPPLSLELHFVYGFLSSEKRNTLFYVHDHRGKPSRRVVKPTDKAKSDLGKGNKDGTTGEEDPHLSLFDKESALMHMPSYLQKQMLFSNKTPIPYDNKYDYCHERYFIYFVSRVAIIYNPHRNEQRFYEGHRYRITALAVHPSKMIVATGETSPSPCIHVWSVVNLEPFKVLQTFHKDGILHVKFSNDGAFLVSVGADPLFSIQIINWKTEETLVFRNTGTSPIFDIIFNPYNKYEFTTVGHHNVTVWELQGRSIIRKNWVHLKSAPPEDGNKSERPRFPIITCASYLNYHLGKDVNSDIIVGNNCGEIGLITFGKYVALRKDAHNGLINCLRVTDMIPKKLLVITTGEDECLRIWDTTFNLVYEANLRRIGLFDVPQSKNISIQSIDVYCCTSPTRSDARQKDNREDQTAKPILLLGTRNGDIFEAVITQNFTGLKAPAEKKTSIPSAKLGITIASLQDIYNEDEEDEDSISSSEDETALGGSKSVLEGSISLSFSTYLWNHSGKSANSSSKYQQRVLFAIHPYSNVMYTVGEDQHIYMWDTEKSKLLMMNNQGLTPIALKLSQNGDILAVGFANGTFVLLNSKMNANPEVKAGGSSISPPTLEWIQPAIKEKAQAPILNIEFSPKGSVLAISYDNVKAQFADEEGKEGAGISNSSQAEKKEGAYIAIYTANIAPGKVRTAGEKIQYTKYTEIRPFTSLQSPEGDSKLQSLAVYSMTFSIDEIYLLLYFQEIDSDHFRLNEGANCQYVVWNIETDSQVSNIDMIKNIRWKKFNFPNNLHAQYIFYNNLLGNEESKKDTTNLARKPVLSSMFDYKPFITAGSVNGDLHFFKSTALCLEKNFPAENIKPDQMCMSKTYAAHVSYVNQVEIKGNYMYSSGVHDGCIMQWKLIREEDHWDADYMDLNLEDVEVNNYLSELPPRDTFENLLNEILPLRHQVSEMRQNADEVDVPELDLELEAIIGRKAFDRRNNLFYDFDERIIYSAGNLIVMCDPASYDGIDDDDESVASLEEDKKIKKRTNARRQEFLRVDEETLFPTAPEVSTFALSLDKRFICVGTQELNARILIWEVCSRTCIKTLKLNNCCTIQNIRFAFNSRHVCAIGLTPEYTQVVYLIDALKPQVLGCVNQMNVLTGKIRDIMFFPNSIYQFITCGVQHMSVWKYSGSTLNYFACPIEKTRDMLFIKPTFAPPSNSERGGLNASQKEDLERLIEENQRPVLEVTFTCICFVQSIPVTGDTNGYIYIWQHNKISKRQTAHFKSAVLCLNALKNSNVFVSGGEDGRVIVWQLTCNPENNNYVTEKFYEYPITSEDITKAHLSPRNHVQSIFIGSRHILAGTKTGDIYELLKPKDSDLKFKNVSYSTLVVNRLSCNDHEVPKALGFSHRMDKIYAITQKGLFCVWDMRSIDLLYSKFFGRNAISLIAFKNKPLILITFDTEIIMLNAEKGGAYKTIPSYQIKYKTQITDVKVSFHEKYMAVALSSDSDTNAKIELYDLESKEGAFKYLFGIEDLVSSVNFLDFSTDNSYILYKDNFGVPTVTNIISRTKVNLVHLEFDVEWVSDGIQESEKTKGVQSYYKANDGVSNRILKMVRIGEDTLAVTDEMGTIRLFRYPCATGSNFGYYRCYSEHMNYLNNCVLSNDRNFLLTSSENDKSIFLWKIKENAEYRQSKKDLN